MKPAIFFLLTILSVSSIFSQSTYSQKWKESVFFSVPHSFEQKEKTEDHVYYVHEDEVATLEIREVSGLDKAVNQANLQTLAVEMAEKLKYSLDGFEEAYPLNCDKSFVASSLLIKEKKRKALLTALYSKKTDRNYIILIEADIRYFRNNEELIKQLSSGLMEF